MKIVNVQFFKVIFNVFYQHFIVFLKKYSKLKKIKSVLRYWKFEVSHSTASMLSQKMPLYADFLGMPRILSRSIAKINTTKLYNRDALFLLSYKKNQSQCECDGWRYCSRAIQFSHNNFYITIPLFLDIEKKIQIQDTLMCTVRILNLFFINKIFDLYVNVIYNSTLYTNAI